MTGLNVGEWIEDISLVVCGVARLGVSLCDSIAVIRDSAVIVDDSICQFGKFAGEVDRALSHHGQDVPINLRPGRLCAVFVDEVMIG